MTCITHIANGVEYDLSNNNPEFNERLERMLAFLKSENVLPAKRSSLTYPQHRKFAGCILTAMDSSEGINRGRLDDSAYLVHTLPTQTSKWMDKMYSKGLLRLNDGQYRVDPSVRTVIPFLTDQEVVVS